MQAADFQCLEIPENLHMGLQSGPKHTDVVSDRQTIFFWSIYHMGLQSGPKHTDVLSDRQTKFFGLYIYIYI